MRSRSVDIGHPVMLREWGEGGGRRIFAVHALGAVSSGALFGCAVGPLVEAGWQVAAPDLPGFADTPSLAPEDYEVTRLAGLMWRVVDATGVGPVVLVGHSVGGAVALRMHALRPDDVRALVLLDSGHLDYGALHPELLDKPLEEWLVDAPDPLLAADRRDLATVLEIDPRGPGAGRPHAGRDRGGRQAREPDGPASGCRGTVRPRADTVLRRLAGRLGGGHPHAHAAGH